MKELLEDPIFLILVCSMLGQLIGKIGIGHFKLGSSGVLFMGLFMSFILGREAIELSVPKEFLQASLIGFIVTVGLKASQDIVEVIKKYGIKFMILGLVVTATGALATGGMMYLFRGMKFEIVGTYIGALTSSPGLASALELVGSGKGAAIGIGYALAYIPGVIIVIIFSQLSGKKYTTSKRADLDIEEKRGEDLSVLKLSVVVLVGLMISFIKVIGMSLGVTGGVLISALIMGSSVKGFAFEEKSLNVIRDISLAAFLAIVGLKYGYEAVSTMQMAGVELLIIGSVTSASSLSVGYLIGKFVLKIDGAILAGGICGGMTSTPGLAAATEAFESDRVTAGYGATYPFALIGMIIFTNMLVG